MPTEFTRVLREPEAAEMLGVSKAALRRWRREKRGPTFVRLERCIGYRLADIETFLTQNLQPRRSGCALPQVGETRITA